MVTAFGKKAEVMSHPSRVRGLKLGLPANAHGRSQSHPSRVRGLKSGIHRHVPQLIWVAPFTGAWIEIQIREAWRPAAPRRTLPGVVVCNKRFLNSAKACRSVAPFTGAWIEISCRTGATTRTSCRTLHGCVD